MFLDAQQINEYVYDLYGEDDDIDFIMIKECLISEDIKLTVTKDHDDKFLAEGWTHASAGVTEEDAIKEWVNAFVYQFDTITQKELDMDDDGLMSQNLFDSDI